MESPESSTEPNVTMNVNTVEKFSAETNTSSSQAVDEVTQQVENKLPSSAPEESTALTLGLLKQVKNFLDVVIHRGVVKPEEMSTVGKMYDQYIAGLKTLMPKDN